MRFLVDNALSPALAVLLERDVRLQMRIESE